MVLIFFKNRKGNVFFETMLILIGIVFLILLSFSLLLPLQEITDSINNDPSSGAEAKTIITEANENFPPFFDNLVTVALALLWIGALVAAYFIDSHPIFFGIAVLLFIGVLFATIAFINGVDDTIDSSFANDKVTLPKSTFIIEHFLEILVVMGFTIMIVLYAKTGS